MDKPTAWADDAALAGKIGNCASVKAKEYWERSNFADRASAERLRHPLYSQAQIDDAVTAEREACAKAAEQGPCGYFAPERIARLIRARSNAEITGRASGPG